MPEVRFATSWDGVANRTTSSNNKNSIIFHLVFEHLRVFFIFLNIFLSISPFICMLILYNRHHYLFLWNCYYAYCICGLKICLSAFFLGRHFSRLNWLIQSDSILFIWVTREAANISSCCPLYAPNCLEYAWLTVQLHISSGWIKCFYALPAFIVPLNFAHQQVRKIALKYTCIRTYSIFLKHLLKMTYLNQNHVILY